VIPSPFAYPGYWAWDSWKHAYALAHFAPELAAEQLRAQFYRQQSDGMVPDTVFPDASQDNWHNTKPPLAAWALDFLVARTGDLDVARELYPKCAAQMRWFLLARRIPGETLFRAGGVDHLTATWDTGWDECARFVGVPLTKHASWMLLDLWQPDYNSYCLNELRALAALAARLGETADAEEWQREADALASAIRRALWNEAKGCFCDVRASTGASTGIRSAAAWLPVWANAADSYQAARVRELLLNGAHFATTMPFPTLAASEPGFNPDGYWSGGVWADHTAYAIYVLGEDGRAARERIRDHIALKDTLYECYSPLDGQPGRGNRPAVSQFSWTAAAGVMVPHGGPRPAPAPDSVSQSD
jgi:putative isomerase